MSPKPPADTFGGFSPELLTFLTELPANNNRAWFDTHRQRYEDHLLFPALDFIAAMGPRLARISPRFEAVPKRMGGSLMRIYRDTRFGNDKTPYKTNVGIQFRHVVGKDIHAPGFYLHIEPGDSFVGVGCWHPDFDALAKIRARLASHPDQWRAVLAERKFRRQYELAGDSLLRPPRGFAADHPLIEDLRRKDFIAVHPLADTEVIDPKLTAKVAALFAAGAGLMQFLCAALEIDF